MKTIYNILALISAVTFSGLVLADDDSYSITNDLSYLAGSIDTRQHIYYPGDTIDVRVSMGGNTALLADQLVDIYLGIFAPNGKLFMIPVKNYQVTDSQRLFFIENLTSAVIFPGTYHMALVATVPGGDPENIADWYNGFGGLLDEDALLYTETAVERDIDSDGEWDDDYDRDGFIGDDDDVYEHYYSIEGETFELSTDHDWEDDDWNDDDEEDQEDEEDDNDSNEDYDN
tara:strand:+ start:418 stop:1107 length:690 start_codon:yes stop_codon:yes gene_type:complete